MTKAYHPTAQDLLNEATYIAEFLQTITLLKDKDEGLLLQGNQVYGLHYVMQDMIDRLQKADALLDGRKEADHE
jgi:hypothetical protein